MPRLCWRRPNGKIVESGLSANIFLPWGNSWSIQKFASRRQTPSDKLPNPCAAESSSFSHYSCYSYHLPWRISFHFPVLPSLHLPVSLSLCLSVSPSFRLPSLLPLPLQLIQQIDEAQVTAQVVEARVVGEERVIFVAELNGCSDPFDRLVAHVLHGVKRRQPERHVVIGGGDLFYVIGDQAPGALMFSASAVAPAQDDL